MAERPHRRAHAPDIAVMVGPEEVDDVVGLAELLEVVEADVHREVGELAVRLPQHAVLVVAERGGAEPERAVLLVGVARRGESAMRALGAGPSRARRAASCTQRSKRVP